MIISLFYRTYRRAARLYIVSLHCMPSILRSVHDALAMNYHPLCGVASVREDGVALTLDDVIGHCSCYRGGDLSDVLQRRVAATLRQQVGGREGCQGGRRDEEVFVRQMNGSHSNGPEADAREYVPVSQYHTRRAPVVTANGTNVPYVSLLFTISRSTHALLPWPGMNFLPSGSSTSAKGLPLAKTHRPIWGDRASCPGMR